MPCPALPSGAQTGDAASGAPWQHRTRAAMAALHWPCSCAGRGALVRPHLGHTRGCGPRPTPALSPSAAALPWQPPSPPASPAPSCGRGSWCAVSGVTSLSRLGCRPQERPRPQGEGEGVSAGAKVAKKMPVPLCRGSREGADPSPGSPVMRDSPLAAPLLGGLVRASPAAPQNNPSACP